jgi:hypothetical protein
MRAYYTHDLGDEPAPGFGEAHRVYLASEIEEAQLRLARLTAGSDEEIARPISERDLKRIIVGYLNAYEAGLAGAEAAWLQQMRRVRSQLEGEQAAQMSFQSLEE